MFLLYLIKKAMASIYIQKNVYIPMWYVCMGLDVFEID